MNNEILFTERQRFKQWWVWLIFIGINAIFILGIIQQIFRGQPFGDQPMSNAGLLITYLFFILLTILFANIRLDTLIKTDGIYVRFSPIHLTYRHFPWDSLSKIYLRKYSAISEYGGWGMRYGLFGRGKAYNVSGNQGLQLEFTNKKKLLIGTNKGDELETTLQNIGQIKY